MNYQVIASIRIFGKSNLEQTAFDSMLLLPEYGSVVCDEDNPRILQTFNLKKGLKGSFRGESGEFKFVVESVHDKVDGAQYPEYKVMDAPAIAASVDSLYISNEEKKEAVIRRQEYHDFYNGLNDWKEKWIASVQGSDHSSQASLAAMEP